MKKVLIVGAGIGGLAAAAAFGQKGFAVDIIEVKQEHSVLGVGIIQPGNQLRALGQLGVIDECFASGFQADEFRYLDENEELLAKLPLLRIADPDKPAANFLFRHALQRILKDAALKAGTALRLGTTVNQIIEDAEGVEIGFSDGSADRYDLVIGADGIRSDMRRRLFGDVQPRYTGHGCWRFTTSRPQEITYQGILMGPGVKAGLVPLSQTSMYLLLVTNEPGNPWMPADQLHHLMAERLSVLKGPLMTTFRERLVDPEKVVYVPIEEVILPLPWYRGRIVLIGDAAHASTPHAAQGASMAVEDAVVLAQECARADSVSAALDAFQSRRYERCKFVQDWSRQLGAEGQVETPTAWKERDEEIKKRYGGTTPQPRAHELVLQQPI